MEDHQQYVNPSSDDVEAQDSDDPKHAVTERLYDREGLHRAWIAPIKTEFRSGAFHDAVGGEFLATLLFVLLTTAVADRATNPDYLVSVSLVFGFSIALMVHNFGHISGAHFNPAVTISLFVTLQISLLRTLCYTVAQLLGALVAASLHYAMLPESTRDSSALGSNLLADGYSAGQGFAWEFVATFFFLLTIFATIDPVKEKEMGALGIGLAGAIAHFALVPITGCGINPARSFGPNVIANALAANDVDTLPSSYWIYWIGPILGGVLASLVYQNFFAADLAGLQRGSIISRFNKSKKLGESQSAI